MGYGDTFFGENVPQLPLKPFWVAPDGKACKLYHGDVVSVLKRLPSRSVHCCVTSPPYWGLRDYGTGTWSGGDKGCDHIQVTAADLKKSSTLGAAGRVHPETNAAYQAGVRQIAGLCGKCGAQRIDQQIGSERTPEEFVAKMVEVFAEVHRVLRDDGTLWLNLGDTYSGGSGTNSEKQQSNAGTMIQARPGIKTLPSGNNLVGVPWRTALALQAWGWVLRQDIIWAKPAPMPESVKNRCTKAHEYIFLLTKGRGYYYDAEAIREESTSIYKSEDFLPDSNKDQLGDASAATMASRANRSPDPINNGRNKRSVWTVSSQGYEGAHFAVFPPKLITPCVLAGTSERGCCAACGASYRRVTEEKGGVRCEEEDRGDRDRSVTRNRNGITGSLDGTPQVRETVGWEVGCTCGAGTVPCTILDPFMGSGTTAAVALEHGRRTVGIDLSDKYLRANAIPRIYETLTGNPAYRGMIKPKMPTRVM